MERQIVNAPGISVAADQIRTANNNINNAFRTMQNRTRSQLNNWRSPAGESAQTIMQQLLQHNEARSTILQNYFNLLARQVNPGYVSAEETNTSLADKFK